MFLNEFVELALKIIPFPKKVDAKLCLTEQLRKIFLTAGAIIVAIFVFLKR
jgi:hypothetical protein